MPELVMTEQWKQPMQAFVQERNDCQFYEYNVHHGVLRGSLEVIKEFIELCELIDLTPN